MDKNNQEPQEFQRTRVPRKNEVVGIVTERFGGSRMGVKCFDGKKRVCRIPGRLKRSLWIREGDYVLVEIWEYGGDDKGDVLQKYTPRDINFLTKIGVIKTDIIGKEF